ncbi:DUF4913 domain-containing protein [Streptomyces cyaneofuscatus]|uniref:DUF4913 domain-containing protein n=1 Tax=Streptomyces cyaneofuscatus TaxID=66883 RepID=UPI0033B34B03
MTEANSPEPTAVPPKPPEPPAAPATVEADAETATTEQPGASSAGPDPAPSEKKVAAPEKSSGKEETPDPDEPQFILYLDGERYTAALEMLRIWVHHLLLPVYGRETVSARPWCPRWWEHHEAVARLYGLWMAWQAQTGGGSDLRGPAVWHRDFLDPVMNSLRDPIGPFAGCKPGSHRPKDIPEIDHQES